MIILGEARAWLVRVSSMLQGTPAGMPPGLAGLAPRPVREGHVDIDVDMNLNVNTTLDLNCPEPRSLWLPVQVNVQGGVHVPVHVKVNAT